MKRIGTFLFLLLGSLFVDPIATSLGSGSNVFVTQSQAQDEGFHSAISQPGFVNAPYSSYDPEFFTGFSTPPVVQARYFVINGMPCRNNDYPFCFLNCVEIIKQFETAVVR